MSAGNAGAALAAHQDPKSVDVSRERVDAKELEELEVENKEMQRKVQNIQDILGSRSHSQIRKPQNLFGTHSSRSVSL